VTVTGYDLSEKHPYTDDRGRAYPSLQDYIEDQMAGGVAGGLVPQYAADLKAWTWDPCTDAGLSAVDQGTGRVHVSRIPVPQRARIGNIWVHVFTGGVTLTAGQNLAWLARSGGIVIPGSVTGDQSGVWNSTGVKTMALAGGAIDLGDIAEGWLYVALLTVGTTPPLFRASTSNTGTANAGTSTPTLRYGLDAATGVTGVVNLTPGTMVARPSVWVALS